MVSFLDLLGNEREILFIVKSVVDSLDKVVSVVVFYKRIFSEFVIVLMF